MLRGKKNPKIRKTAKKISFSNCTPVTHLETNPGQLPPVVSPTPPPDPLQERHLRSQDNWKNFQATFPHFHCEKRSFSLFLSYDSFHVLISRFLGDFLHHLTRQICAAKPAGLSQLGRGIKLIGEEWPGLERGVGVGLGMGIGIGIGGCVKELRVVHQPDFKYLSWHAKTKLLGPLSVQLPRTTSSFYISSSSTMMKMMTVEVGGGHRTHCR